MSSVQKQITSILEGDMESIDFGVRIFFEVTLGHFGKGSSTNDDIFHGQTILSILEKELHKNLGTVELAYFSLYIK